MSDTRLRELQRRWNESGAVQDEAELLKARVRAGEVHAGRLELAAHCGHEAARVALGQVPAGQEEGAASILRWGERFAAWGKEACVRVALVACRRAAEQGGGARLDLSRETARALEEWVLDPRREAAVRVRQAIAQLEALGASAAGPFGRCLTRSAALVGEARGETVGEALLWSVSARRGEALGERSEDELLGLDRQGAEGEGPSALLLRRAIAAELVPWALGRSDCVAERVAARRRRLVCETCVGRVVERGPSPPSGLRFVHGTYAFDGQLFACVECATLFYFLWDRDPQEDPAEASFVFRPELDSEALRFCRAALHGDFFECSRELLRELDLLRARNPEPRLTATEASALLKSEDEAAVAEAAWLVGWFGGAARVAIPALAACLPRGYPVSRPAARALACMGRAALPTLLAALEHEDRRVRQLAAEALAALGSEGAEAFDLLLRSFTAPQGELEYSAWSSLRRVCARALGALGAAGEAAIPALIDGLDDSGVSSAAVEGLGALGERALPALRECMRSGDVARRAKAVKAMGRVGPAALSELEAALEDPSARVARAAESALRRIRAEGRQR